jgi:hypothetical protein
MELVKQPLGTEGHVTISIVKGKLLVAVSHKHASGEVMMSVSEDASYFFDKLSAAIPGTLDDAVLAVLKASIMQMA